METLSNYGVSSDKEAAADQALKPNQPLHISPEGKSYLITTAKWSMFIAIVGFVTIISLIVSGIATMSLSSVVDEYRDFQMLQYFPVSIYVIGITNILTAVICFFPTYYLYNFSKKIKLGMASDNQDFLNEGLKNMKKTAKFTGIVTIILLAMTLLLIPAMIFSIGMLKALSGGGMVV